MKKVFDVTFEFEFYAYFLAVALFRELVNVRYSKQKSIPYKDTVKGSRLSFSKVQFEKGFRCKI